MLLGIKKLYLAPVSLMIAIDPLCISGTRILAKNYPLTTQRIARNASLCISNILVECKKSRAASPAKSLFGFVQRNERASIQPNHWHHKLFGGTAGRALLESATSIESVDDVFVEPVTDGTQAESQISSSIAPEDKSVSDDGSPKKTKKRRLDRKRGGGPAKGELLELVCDSLAFKVGTLDKQWLLPITYELSTASCFQFFLYTDSIMRLFSPKYYIAAFISTFK